MSDDTLVDTWTNKAKNHPGAAVVIVLYLLVSGLFQAVDLSQKIWGLAHPPQDTSNVFVDCRLGTMPSIMPPEGRIPVLLTSELPKENGGGGFGDYFGQPGSTMKWSNEQRPDFVYRCEMTNNSPAPLLNVAFDVHLVFRQPELVPKNPNARRQGAITLDREWPVTIPKIDVGRPFVFYVWNRVERFVQVSLPSTLVTEGGKTIPIIQAKNHLFEALYPVPWPATVKP